MAHTIALTDEDYARLVSASTHSGKPIEELLHEAITAYSAPPEPSDTYQYRKGKSISKEEWDAEEELAQEIGSEHPWASEMAIEDRGPR